MRFTLEAACGCKTGKVRRNNEDNFFFDGKCLEKDNKGLKYPVTSQTALDRGYCVAVFDGMGGEQFGEYASFVAARAMQQAEREESDFYIPVRRHLTELVNRINDAVVKAQEELCTNHMGATMALLYFMGRYVYSCNLGDTRTYRLRDGEFLQLSRDHLDKRPGEELKKAPVTRYLGFNREELELEPYISKGELQQGDRYLICSDGLTDMLTNFEIAHILLREPDAESCVDSLIRAALDHGGRDNVTAIVCAVM